MHTFDALCMIVLDRAELNYAIVDFTVILQIHTLMFEL